MHMKLDFKRDNNHEILSKKLNKTIGQTYPAASLQFKAHPILPGLTTLLCAYKFNCSCESSYMGRTTRQSSKQIKEHIPDWLRKRLTKSI